MAPEPTELSPALERVVAEYTAMVRSVARRRGLPEGDLEEVLQDVRIRLWRALGSGERIAASSTSYVYQTAMSAVCDLLRRRRGDRWEPLDSRALELSGAKAAGEPDRSYERKELALQIEHALSELGPNQRPVVRMYLAGYAQAEIQDLLGWTEAKTRNLLYRGLAQLRETLARQGITPGAAR